MQSDGSLLIPVEVSARWPLNLALIACAANSKG